MQRSVFHFTDYRAYLRDWYEAKKAATPGWSYGTWTRKLGLRSASGLHMVVNGRRNPGSKMVRALVKQLRLDPSEAQYFGDLVRLQQCGEDVRLSVLLMEDLSRQCERAGHQLLDPLQFAAISGWYFFALRELVRLPGFREDAEWIASRFAFRVLPGEIHSALRILIKLGLLTRDARGQLQLTSEHLNTRSDIADEGQKRFHESALEHARQSLRTVPPEEREITGTSFALSRNGMSKAKDLIRKFQNDLCDLVESPDTDRVYQLEIALYPLWRNR
jgi:uncharacterized protein (TIGR02147 family)